MCYNETTSWVAFSIGSIALGAAAHRGSKEGNEYLFYTALAFVSIVVIQLYEALLYRNCENEILAKVLRKLILFTICMQPILLFLSAKQDPNRNFEPFLSNICKILLVLYVCFMLYTPPGIRKSNQSCGKWEFESFHLIPGILYHILLLLSLLLPKANGMVLFLTGLVTLIASLFMGSGQPSKWCLLASVTPIALILTR